jgi:Ca2+-binding EF-hand superfamily protein
MNPALERELCALIYEGEILTFRACEERRKDLVKRHDFSTYACFRAVDEMNEGEINLDNMRAFLKRAGHYPTEEEVIAIVRRLDTNADSSVSYAEFSEAIKPQEFSMTNMYIVPPKSV